MHECNLKIMKFQAYTEASETSVHPPLGVEGRKRERENERMTFTLERNRERKEGPRFLYYPLCF